WFQYSGTSHSNHATNRSRHHSRSHGFEERTSSPGSPTNYPAIPRHHPCSLLWSVWKASWSGRILLHHVWNTKIQVSTTSAPTAIARLVIGPASTSAVNIRFTEVL